MPSIPQVRQQPEQQRQFMSDGTPIPPPPSKGRPPLRKRKGPARVVQYDDHYDHEEDKDDSEILEDSGDDEWQNSGSESGRDGSGRYDMRGVPPPPHREVPQYSTETPRQWFNGEPANSPVPPLPSREPQVWYGAGVEDDALPLPPRRPSREDLPPRPRRTEDNGNDESSDWSPASVKSLARTLSQSGIQIFAKGMH